MRTFQDASLRRWPPTVPQAAAFGVSFAMGLKAKVGRRKADPVPAPNNSGRRHSASCEGRSRGETIRSRLHIVSCTISESWAGSDLRGSLGGGCGMEYPTEDEVRAMTNREFASLIRSQAEMIDQSLHRDKRLVPESPGGPMRI